MDKPARREIKLRTGDSGPLASPVADRAGEQRALRGMKETPAETRASSTEITEQFKASAKRPAPLSCQIVREKCNEPEARSVSVEELTRTFSRALEGMELGALLCLADTYLFGSKPGAKGLADQEAAALWKSVSASRRGLTLGRFIALLNASSLTRPHPTEEGGLRTAGKKRRTNIAPGDSLEEESTLDACARKIRESILDALQHMLTWLQELCEEVAGFLAKLAVETVHLVHFLPNAGDRTNAGRVSLAPDYASAVVHLLHNHRPPASQVPPLLYTGIEEPQSEPVKESLAPLLAAVLECAAAEARADAQEQDRRRDIEAEEDRRIMAVRLKLSALVSRLGTERVPPGATQVHFQDEWVTPELLNSIVKEIERRGRL